jgi:uncharacterized repeat protein (TIGR03943 family)
MVAAVTRATQTVLLTVTGVVLIRMAAGGTYLNYVNAWMRWPLIACGVLLVLLGVLELLKREETEHVDDDESSHVPHAAWLLFAPSLVFFLIAPPALGAHFAERAQTVSVPTEASTEVDLPPLPSTDPAPLVMDELMMRAAYDEGETLAGRRLEITGFVSSNRTGWFVNQFSMNCCAADAAVMRIEATGADAPPDDQWVRLVGTHVAGTGNEGRTTPEIVVESIELIEAPDNQYR